MSEHLDPEAGCPRQSHSVPKVQCPKCQGWFSKVKDGRANEQGYRRKRECQSCGKVFFTVEQAA